MTRTDAHVLIVGCGNLGRRHLQAVASLPQVKKIEIVDSNTGALELGRRLLEDDPVCLPSPSPRWITSLDAVTLGGDICIVATQAKGRARLIKKIAGTLKYRNFLIEKIASQSTSEYEDLIQFAKAHSLKIWVNCKTRAYPVHQYIKSQLNGEEPILFNSMAGNHGLANNGTHAADLFAFYDNAQKIERVSAVVDPVLHPSKRGKEIFDLSGTLVGKTEKGSVFTLSYAGHHASFDHFVIVTKSHRWIIDHFLRWAVESRGEKGGDWKPIPFEGNLMVSQMTKIFAGEILEKGNCLLPTLEECWPAHRFILESLQPHFNKLLGKNLNYCPVT